MLGGALHRHVRSLFTCMAERERGHWWDSLLLPSMAREPTIRPLPVLLATHFFGAVVVHCMIAVGEQRPSAWRVSVTIARDSKRCLRHDDMIRCFIC